MKTRSCFVLLILVAMCFLVGCGTKSPTQILSPSQQIPLNEADGDGTVVKAIGDPDGSGGQAADPDADEVNHIGDPTADD